ncbi:hypothetical protein AB0G74_08770 [Streptomyces sp. NPDC020875]|uniref:hypothetical protein n=1 Tax=Streptomyces sp. NPDC020875 TaxID=3154898 RepID=UPI00340247E4
MARYDKRRHDGPQGPHGPETFYVRRGPATSVLALVAAATAVFLLVLSGRFAQPGATTTGPVPPEPDPHEMFLGDLSLHRPSGESVVRSGMSKPGIPVSLPTGDFNHHAPHRLAYRCQGPGSMKLIAITPDGTRRRFPATACGAPITSLALSGYRSVTLAADDPTALLLWAVTTAQPPVKPSDNHP